jgi:hypothetical protein
VVFVTRQPLSSYDKHDAVFRRDCGLAVEIGEGMIRHRSHLATQNSQRIVSVFDMAHNGSLVSLHLTFALPNRRHLKKVNAISWQSQISNFFGSLCDRGIDRNSVRSRSSLRSLLVDNSSRHFFANYKTPTDKIQEAPREQPLPFAWKPNSERVRQSFVAS